MNEDELAYVTDYANTTSQSYINTANSMFSHASQTEQALSGQLMLLNTVVLTIVLLAIGNEGLFNLLTDPHKFLISVNVFLQCVSIVCGIVSYKMREKFFAESGDTAHTSSQLIMEKQYNTLSEMRENVRANDAKQDSQSNSLMVNIQIASIILSLALFFALMVAILFDMPLYSN